MGHTRGMVWDKDIGSMQHCIEPLLCIFFVVFFIWREFPENNAILGMYTLAWR